MVQDLFVIGDKMRTFLQRLSADLTVALLPNEIDQVFKDEQADQVFQKFYNFYVSKSLRITGVVGEYEPETIWIQVQGKSSQEKAFRRLTDEFRLILGPNGPIY